MAPKRRPSVSAYQLKPKPTTSATTNMAMILLRNFKD
jgi:hypothetical protein